MSQAPDSAPGFVRPARAGDAAGLARVQVASWRCGFAGIVPTELLAELTSEEAEQVWRDRWRDAIANPPTPLNRTRLPASCLILAISCAPSASPDGSPQTSITVICLDCASAGVTA